MIIKIDVAKLKERAEALPLQAKLGEVDEKISDLMYTAQEDGSLSLNREARDNLVAEYSKAIETHRLREENAAMRDKQDRADTLRTVREEMAHAGVRPGLLDAATALFCSQHKFGRTPDGRLFIVGKIGKSDAESALIAWVSGEDGEAFREPNHSTDAAGSFTAAIRRLKGSAH